jgi:hypothetical protein
MNKSIIVVTVTVAVIALAVIMSTVVTSDVLADNKKDRANKVLDKHISAGEGISHCIHDVISFVPFLFLNALILFLMISIHRSISPFISFSQKRTTVYPFNFK